MAEYQLNHSLHGNIRVNLDKVPDDPGELKKALNEQIKAGRYESMPEDGQPKSILARADEMYRQAAAAVTKPVGSALSSGLSAVGVPEDYAGPIGEGAAKFLIPQTPLEAGMMIGTGGAGGLAAKLGLKGAKAVGTRIAGGLLGGAMGGAVSEDPVTGAVIGGLTGGAAGVGGEIVGKAAGWAGKTIANVMRGGSQEAVARVQVQAAKALGETLSKEIPELAGVVVDPVKGALTRGASIFEGYSTPSSLRKLVMSGEGSAMLQDAYAAGLQQVKNIPIHGGSHTIDSFLYPSPMRPGVHIPFDEARKELSELGAKAFSPKQANPETANILGADAKEAWNKASDAIYDRLNTLDSSGLAAAAFQATKDQYRVGLNLIKSLKPAFREKAHDRIVFDVSALQGSYADKERAYRAGSNMGSQVYEKVSSAFLRGAMIGLRDQPPVASPVAISASTGLPGSAYARESLRGLMTGPPRLAGQTPPLGVGRTIADIGTGRGVAPVAQGVLDEMGQ